MPLTPAQRMSLAHAIARAAIERCEFEEAMEVGERIDYRVTLGAALRLLYTWERMCGAVYWSGSDVQGTRECGAPPQTTAPRPLPRSCRIIDRIEVRRRGSQWVAEMALASTGFVRSADVLTLDLDSMAVTLHLDKRAQNLVGELLCEAWGVTVAPTYDTSLENAA